MPAVPRPLHPALNAPGYMAAAGTIFAATAMIYNAYYHHGVINVPVIVAAVGAVAALLTRQVVTPVADPKDGNGNPLVPLQEQIPAGIIPAAPETGVRIVPPPSGA